MVAPGRLMVAPGRLMVAPGRLMVAPSRRGWLWYAPGTPRAPGASIDAAATLPDR
jgi:hypothetical protein